MLVRSSWLSDLRDMSSMGVVTRITPGGMERSSSSDSESSLSASMRLSCNSRGFTSGAAREYEEGMASGGAAGASPWKKK